MKPLRYMLLSLCVLVALPLMVSGASATKVALIPYVMNADQDLTFLQNGVFDMMSSRLSSPKVSVVDRATINKTIVPPKNAVSTAAAREVGKRLGADYVVYGSITKIGDDISLDTKILPVAGEANPETFSETCKSLGEIIPKLNSTATQINNRYFGGGAAAAAVATPTARTTATPAPAQPSSGYDHRMDPNKMVKDGVVQDKDAQMARSQNAILSGQFWKSQSFKEYLTGIAIGDVDGDGRTEVVLSSKNGLYIYRFVDNRLTKVATLLEKTKNTIVSIDVADINGNGYPEIFVSALGPNLNVMTSAVYEFDGKTYKAIVKDSPYFYRVTKPYGDMVVRPVLLAQLGTTLESPYERTFYELTWNNGDYHIARTMRIHRGQNVLGFSMGTFNRDGAEMFVGYDTSDYLNMFGADGRFVWKGNEHLGGRHVNMNLRETSVNETENYRYLPMRTLGVDMNGDGSPEIITVKNERISEFLSFRSFTSGQLQILNWDGLGMDLIASSRKLSGMVTDFALGDFDNDGQKEIAVLHIIETGSIAFTTARAVLIVYKLNNPQLVK